MYFSVGNFWKINLANLTQTPNKSLCDIVRPVNSPGTESYIMWIAGIKDWTRNIKCIGVFA